MRQTEHRSDAVQAYKRSSKEQDIMISSILQSPPQKKPFHFLNNEDTFLAEKAESSVMDVQSTSTTSLEEKLIAG